MCQGYVVNVYKYVFNVQCLRWKRICSRIYSEFVGDAIFCAPAAINALNIGTMCVVASCFALLLCTTSRMLLHTSETHLKNLRYLKLTFPQFFPFEVRQGRINEKDYGGLGPQLWKCQHLLPRQKR